MNTINGEDITVEHMCHQVGKEPTIKIGTVSQLFQHYPLLYAAAPSSNDQRQYMMNDVKLY